MKQLQNMYLGAPGADYVNSYLEGERGLCKHLSALHITPTSVFAPVPDGTSVLRAITFQSGGFMKASESDDWLKQHLDELWSAEPNGTVILQDIWAIPGDAEMDDLATISNECVYYIMDNTISKLISAVTNRIRSFNYTATFIVLPASEVSELIAADRLDAIAAHAKEIIVSSYDQEGYVVATVNSYLCA